ncbi:MAG TPA: hypothetical protein VG123_35880 [Streptosporangiaceae bacterium]|nr:hypothetical protein [Streptosporangiaceae bacterium]HJY61455.1 hypothetical protein [Streptosporangiaceae bacterium]HJY66763.1 hypothetical protein [Streptosporangiaceae bacterium]
MLRELRAQTGLSQEKRTEAPGHSPRATSDPKRVATPHKDTARLLADTLEPAMPGT